MTSSGDDPRETPLGVVSRWQQLASMDRHSPEFVPLLASLTTEENRSLTMGLCGANARDALSIMDEVIGSDVVPSKYWHRALNIMRKLANNSGQVPARYQVDRRSLTVEAVVIANGISAEVRQGRLGGRTVAIRTLRNDRKVDKNKSQKLFCKESIMWMNFSHPNILQLIGVDIDSQTGQCSMISEMMSNGNIREYIRQNSANRHHLLEGVAAGLCYLHEHGIAHGDLKGSNILITNDTPPRACLADFGLATLAPSTEGATTTNTAGGTLLYMAPELLFPSKFGNQTARPTKPADVYALGMVIFEVLTGLQPFHERKWPLVEIFYHVMKGERPAKPSDAEQVGFGGGTWELVEECWKEEPTERPTAERVLTHLSTIAASSAAVGPTSEIPPENPLELDSSSEMQQLDCITAAIRHHTIAAISTVSPARTNNILSSPRVSSYISPVSSRGSGDVNRNVTSLVPFKPKTPPLFTSPTRKSPFQRSILAIKPQLKTKVSPKTPSRFGRLGWHGVLNKLTPKRAVGPPGPKTHKPRSRTE
ncbi:kinase-like domain-containing protein [Thelephora terrestris]|uniref:Kinase-like domain-containing protein n=1 Tax=Thelephora terrestris TaxID=56493 RepID=A0A9P6H7N4_9AGAM|nr:kinase-like domain-containing protein [Thelephora terrestris]